MIISLVIKVRTKIKKKCIQRGLEEVRSKRYSPVYRKCVIAAKNTTELSGYVTTYPMPPTDRFILRTVGFGLSQ